MDNRPTDRRALRELANSPEIQDECRRMAKDVQRDARRLAPVESGNLRRNIVIEEITDIDTGVDGFAVGWSDRGYYGMLVELGTEDTPARPHLVPAAVKNGATGAVGL